MRFELFMISETSDMFHNKRLHVVTENSHTDLSSSQVICPLSDLQFLFYMEYLNDTSPTDMFNISLIL